MCRRNMFTFNFKSYRQNLRLVLKTSLGVMGWLVLLEVFLQLVLLLPASISKHPRRFLGYGATVETKIRREFKKGQISKRSTLRAGWISPEMKESHKEKYDVAFYGMSFTNQIAALMSELRTDLKVLSIAGPGSPLSHSFESHAQCSSHNNPKHAIIGVTSIWKLVSMTTDTMGNAGIQPCTYPRFKLRDGELVKYSPVLNSFEDLEHALHHPEVWNQHIQLLAQHDRFYNTFLYNANFVEKSILGRISLHGFLEQRSHKLRSQIHNAQGFTNRSVARECAAIAQRLLVEFHANATRRGQHPIVLLLHKKEYADHLYQMLGETLTQHQIDFVSTHTIFSSSDNRNFGSDNYHFTRENNLKILDAILQLIEQHDLAHHGHRRTRPTRPDPNPRFGD